MMYSSAYLFARKITGGESPLSDNVYFDAGRFNLNIIPDGFDFVNNVQRFPIGASGQGETVIMQNGYFNQYVKTGAILASYGGGGREFVLNSESIDHIYDQGYYPSNYFWTSYFLPVKKDMWNTGLTKVCVNVAISTVGKTDTDYMAFDMAGVYHDPDYDADRGYVYMFPRWVDVWEQYSETLTEQTHKADFSEMFDFNDSELIYILIRVPSSGTYIIRKIWFEGDSLSDNVIFDNGMFNPNRMKTGFDLVNNTYLAQDVYSGISYSSGYLPIEQGGFSTQIAADDGACFVNIGTDRGFLTFGDGYLEHVGDHITPDVDGCDYYLPVDMQKFSDEGYTSFNVTLDYHYSPVQTVGSLFTMQIFGVDGSKLQDMASGGGRCPDTSSFTERTFSMPVGTYSETFVPKYICIRMTSGTYRIKKMWFE